MYIVAFLRGTVQFLKAFSVPFTASRAILHDHLSLYDHGSTIGFGFVNLLPFGKSHRSSHVFNVFLSHHVQTSFKQNALNAYTFGHRFILY